MKKYLIVDRFWGPLSYSRYRVCMAHHVGVASTAMKDSNNLHTPEWKWDDSLSIALYLCQTHTASPDSLYPPPVFMTFHMCVCAAPNCEGLKWQISWDSKWRPISASQAAGGQVRCDSCSVNCFSRPLTPKSSVAWAPGCLRGHKGHGCFHWTSTVI